VVGIDIRRCEPEGGIGLGAEETAAEEAEQANKKLSQRRVR
jgi:hypothetical protein